MEKTESKNERSQLISLNILNILNNKNNEFIISLKVIWDFFNNNYLSVKISCSIILVIIIIIGI